MNKRRLLKLADLLEQDAKNKKGVMFDMRDWGTITNPKKPISCGTAACAMGLAALSGKFKRVGLNYKLDSNNWLNFIWKGRRVEGYAAARKLFEINNGQADGLFSSFSYDPGMGSSGAEAERAKAKQIRKFVKTGEL